MRGDFTAADSSSAFGLGGEAGMVATGGVRTDKRNRGEQGGG
ncbi:hypothetical protein STTU_3393 [Streptomyces sp. Tu6071]|nr:hypothetical protein STTU_3393 [Streptomyces sp. Tu6071]